MAPLRSRLKAATSGLHERVDRGYGDFRLETPTGYRDFLLAHARAVIPAEEALEQAGIVSLVPDWLQRRRRDALRLDLLQLGEAIPTPLHVPRSTSAAWCWGFAYVLEGSRLGARVLSRIVESQQAGLPLRYLGQGSDQPLWPRFVDMLETAAQEQPFDEVAEGARAAFELFVEAAWLQREATADCLA
ncbi:biliverdin-producing heme oxygenase [Stutzerimonas azotifigens]|uniref:Biliverdin-producing heme oxygenase n=1 Tax=Stutzerimonas azotifigens TaxID=291995 RepID=A0ABR5Z4R7_9GAMM|nr:biliverdin-producing heme oxygenase [Stutzerimonas azotifigens]MBA1275196.1 biliverdin-producing heme oxygenase [Stutzerimonas azotifigens]